MTTETSTHVRPDPVEARPARPWAIVEREIREQLCAELQAAGAVIGPEQLRWASDELRTRLINAAGGRAIQSGRLGSRLS